MILHRKTKLLFDAFLRNPNSSLIIECPSDEDSRQFVIELTNNLLSSQDKHDVHYIQPEDNKSFSIENSRHLKEIIVNKPASNAAIARIIVLYGIENATREAYNALLKLLEEPPAKTVICLVVTSRINVPATILSRCHHIPILPISLEQATKSLRKNINIDESKIAKLYSLSRGYATLLHKLAVDNSGALLQDVSTAKEFLKFSTFERLIRVKTFAKDSNDLKKLCENLLLISGAALHQSSYANSIKWRKVLTQVKRTCNLLESNTQAKLAYLELCIGI